MAATEDQSAKLDEHLSAAREALKVQNYLEAENQITRASMLQTQVANEELLDQYKELYATVLDHNNRFAEAALRYYDLSLKAQLPEVKAMENLQNALSCTVLAPPGVHRTRLLKMIFKDERSQHLHGFSILRNMYLERIVDRKELPAFENTLNKNKQQSDKDGASILERSVLQHNLLAVSRIYKCVSFDDTAELLGISANTVEKVVTKLIATKCLYGEVDQIDRMITFSDPTKVPPTDWNAYIISICEQTNKVGELIAQKFPDWHAVHAGKNN